MKDILLEDFFGAQIYGISASCFIYIPSLYVVRALTLGINLTIAAIC